MINNKKLTKYLITLCAVLSLAACSVSPKVQAVRIGDENLSKQELLTELKKLDDAEREINGNRGVNVTNVAAAVFWLPGLAYTMIDAHEASNLIHERRSHLVNIYNSKINKPVTVAKKTTKQPVKAEVLHEEQAA